MVSTLDVSKLAKIIEVNSEQPENILFILIIADESNSVKSIYLILLQLAKKQVALFIVVQDNLITSLVSLI